MDVTSSLSALTAGAVSLKVRKKSTASLQVPTNGTENAIKSQVIADGTPTNKGSPSGSVSIKVPSEGASQSKTKEIDFHRITVLSDATSVTSSCMVTASLQVLPTEGKEPKSKVMTDLDPNTKDSVSGSVFVQVPAEDLAAPEPHSEVPLDLSLGVPSVTIWETEQLTVPDVTVPVSAVPNAPTLEAALQDVSCPASIIEI